MGETQEQILGPIDFVAVDFPGNQFNGEVLPAITDLIARGIVRILDVAFVAKDADGVITTAEIEDLDDAVVGPLKGMSEFLADLVTEEELLEAGQQLEPNSTSAVLVWENTWAIPFITAVRGSGGEVTASGRLSGAAVLEALASQD